jgi:hypothetical protein
MMGSLRQKAESTTGEIVGFEEAMAKINLELMNPVGDKLKTLSDVTPQEVFGLSIIGVYERLFNSKVLSSWTKDFLDFRISRLRLGRREFVSIGTGMSEYAASKKGPSRGGGDIFGGLK